MAGKSKNAKLRARLRAAESRAAASTAASAGPAKSKRRRGKKAAAAGGSLQKTMSSGRDLLAALSVAPSKAGQVLWTRALSPLSLKETRLAAEAALWARWRPRRLVVELESATCAAAFGLLVFGWTADEQVSLASTSLSNIKRVGAFGASSTGPLGSKLMLNVPVDSARKWYDADSPVLGEGAHGTFALVAASEVGGYTGNMGVTISLSWQVEFEGATLPPVPAAGGATKIWPDAEWAGLSLFTTSSAEYSSSILTIKAHSGGGIVTYSGAAYGAVYKIAQEGALKYVKSDGKTENVTYASRARDTDQPWLVLHATYQDGKDYQTSGAEGKCLAYTAAGPWGGANVEFDTATSESVSLVEVLAQKVERLELALARLAGEAPPPQRRHSVASDFSSLGLSEVGE